MDLSSLFVFFNIDVLSVYQNNPHKYKIFTDNFEGSLTITDSYYKSNNEEYMSLQFGYKLLKDNSLAIAVLNKDFKEMNQNDQNKWIGFIIDRNELTTTKDERFQEYTKRYILGDWEVENGILFRIQEILEKINALSLIKLNRKLFKYDHEYLSYPSSENNHSYQDAHSKVYGYLIDGLEMETIKILADQFGITLEKEISNKVKALKKIVPEKVRILLQDSFQKISRERGFATHQARKPAKAFPAFSEFNKDMKTTLESLIQLKLFLENKFGINSKDCLKRLGAQKMLPKFNANKRIMPNYSINHFKKIKGKTINNIELGFRESISGIQESELVILHFTDGSSLSIATGSNFNTIMNSKKVLKENDLEGQFCLTFVPPINSESIKE